jgi:carbonic anhydrase
MLKTWANTWRYDVPASLVVFLVAVPLSLGIALASGAPIFAGLVAAAVGGIVVGFFGGAPLQVSGPAAGLTVIVYTAVNELKDWRLVALVVIIAGVIQLAFGLFKIAHAALAISPAVVHGMLAGIGVVITLAQLHVVLGGTPESKALKNIAELPAQIANLHGPATLIGILTIGILIGWQYVPRGLKGIPGALVAITISTLVSVFLHAQGWDQDLKNVDLSSAKEGFQFPMVSGSTPWGTVLTQALIIAVVASVESLLSAVATDRMHTGQRANLDKELVGQGVGNIVSGALGGLPITGVIVRSSANINTGAKSNLSAILHGVWIVLCAALLAGLIEQIPLAALAGLLCFVGTKLVNIQHIRELAKHKELPVYLVTLVGVVTTNLLEGVAIGLALGVFLLLRRLAHLEIKISEQNETQVVHIDGSLTFATVPKLIRELSKIRPGAIARLELHSDFMDHAAYEALQAWENNHVRTGGEVIVDELHQDWYRSAADHAPRIRRSTVRSSREPIAVLTGNQENV